MWSILQPKNVPHPHLAHLTVTIDVFRIYLGCTWADAEAVARLTRGLDAVPGLLYRFDRPAPATPEMAAEPHEVRALTRIAMTQSHVCLVRSEGAKLAPDALAIELELARHTFRRRLPVVLIAEPDSPADISVAADATVAWCPTSIATAMQQVAEEAAAAHRALYRRIAATATTTPQPDAVVPTGPRDGLPVAEIVRAYEDYRARRRDAGRNQP